jgi:hypothetical protein
LAFRTWRELHLVNKLGVFEGRYLAGDWLILYAKQQQKCGNVVVTSAIQLGYTAGIIPAGTTLGLVVIGRNVGLNWRGVLYRYVAYQTAFMLIRDPPLVVMAYIAVILPRLRP